MSEDSDADSSPSLAPLEPAPKINTPDSEIDDANPPADFSTYSAMIQHIAKALDLTAQQPPQLETDKVYEDIDQESSPPFRLSFIPSLFRVMKGLGTSSSRSPRCPGG